MTEPNLVEILAELPEERRYHTVLDILGSTGTGRMIHDNLALERDEMESLIPRDLLLETLTYFEGTNTERYAVECVAEVQGVRRKDPDLIRKGAVFLERGGSFTKAGCLYKEIGDFGRAAECHQREAEKFTPRYIEWMGGEAKHEARETWERAAKLWESAEEWERSSLCYEEAGKLEGRGTRNLSAAIYVAEKYDTDRAISLALSNDEMIDTGRAFHAAVNAGRYDQAISLAPNDNPAFKMDAADNFGRYKEAVVFARQIEDEEFQEALEYYEQTDEGTEIALSFRTGHLFRNIARLARKAGMTGTEDRFYSALIRKRLNDGDTGTAEDLAFESKRWKDFARARLEKGYDPRFNGVYQAILDESHTEKTELLEQAFEDSQGASFPFLCRFP